MHLIPRIHLSTAIILMFVAGAMYWINTAGTLVVRKEVIITRVLDSTSSLVQGIGYGWPCTSIVVRQGEWGEYYSVSYANLAIDILFAVAIFALTAFLAEYISARFSRKHFSA